MDKQTTHSFTVVMHSVVVIALLVFVAQAHAQELEVDNTMLGKPAHVAILPESPGISFARPVIPYNPTSRGMLISRKIDRSGVGDYHCHPMQLRHLVFAQAKVQVPSQSSRDSEDPAAAWTELGEQGGGRVDGERYNAKDCFEMALSFDEGAFVAWYYLGALGGGEVNGQIYSEKACYEKTLSLNPSDGVAWSNLGAEGGGVVNGQNYTLEACYEKALSLNPKCHITWSNLGAEGGGEVDGQKYSEKECYEKALSLNPNDDASWINLGTVGGGEVDGQKYSDEECYEKAESVTTTPLPPMPREPEDAIALSNLDAAGGGRHLAEHGNITCCEHYREVFSIPVVVLIGLFVSSGGCFTVFCFRGIWIRGAWMAAKEPLLDT